MTSRLHFGKKPAICAGSIKQGCFHAVVFQEWVFLYCSIMLSLKYTGRTSVQKSIFCNSQVYPADLVRPGWTWCILLHPFCCSPDVLMYSPCTMCTLQLFGMLSFWNRASHPPPYVDWSNNLPVPLSTSLLRAGVCHCRISLGNCEEFF